MISKINSNNLAQILTLYNFDNILMNAYFKLKYTTIFLRYISYRQIRNLKKNKLVNSLFSCAAELTIGPTLTQPNVLTSVGVVSFRSGEKRRGGSKCSRHSARIYPTSRHKFLTE